MASPLRTVCLASMTAWAAAGLPLQERERVRTDETYGFRIERPDERWTFAPGPGKQEGGAALHVALAGRGGAVEVVVHALPRLEASSAEELRAEARARVAGTSGIRSAETFETRVAGRKAPGLEVLYDAPGGESWRVRQSFLAEPGIAYVLESHAPLGEWDQHARALERIVGSFELLAPSPDRRFDLRIRALAARCGSEVDWAAGWDAAAQRANEGKKPVLVLVRAYPGFEIPDSTRTSTFMDEDLIALVRERFVPLRLEQGMQAPMRDAARYGMGPHTFGAALLVVAPDGVVLAETPALDPHAVHGFLRAALARHPEHPGAAVPEDIDRAARAELHLRRGEHERAAELLREPANAREHRLLAVLHRRERRGAEALAEIDKALAACAGEEKAALGLERAGILVLLGRGSEAPAIFDHVLSGPPAAPERPLALYGRGVLALTTGGREGAERAWRKLVTDHPESRWAWKAAAAWKLTASVLELPVRAGWPAEEVLALTRAVPKAPLAASAARSAEDGALDWLLAAQRADGSWASPSELGAASGERIDPFVDAYTALAARALLGARDRSGARAAVEKALRFLLASHERSNAAGETAWYMDYTVWSRSAALWLFADCLAAKIGEREKLRPAMRGFVASLKEKQKPGGGWSYYVTGDVTAGAKPSNASISFVTAFVSLALGRAREAGVDVPKAVEEGALDCLEAMRNANGTFAYMLSPGAGAGARDDSIPGAAGRSPVCELALLRGGRSDPARIRKAMELFVAHKDGLAREVGKALMHAGPDGQGAHYVLYDYWTAGLALRSLPAKEREPARTVLLELVLAAHRTDGAFQDTPVLGPTCGTALAVLALQELGPSP